MNRRDACAGRLFATDSCEEERSLCIRSTEQGFVAGKGTSKRAAAFMNSPSQECRQEVP